MIARRSRLESPASARGCELRGRRAWLVALSGALLGTFAVVPVGAQVLSGELLYTAVQPCRVFDTRLQAAGSLAANTSRTFHVVGNSSDFVAQGGKAGGCGVPGFSGGKPQAIAVMINVIAVAPQGAGNLRAFPTDAAQVPLASVLNYTDVNLANGFVLPLRQDAEGSDIRLQADVSGTHVVADVLGFFRPARPRRYYLTSNNAFDGSEAALACAGGFHMASLVDILDPSNLQYDATLGITAQDAGSGPPAAAQGWIRTGMASNEVAIAGAGNCNAWSATTGSGTQVSLGNGWTSAATLVSPWVASTAACAVNSHVWCVED